MASPGCGERELKARAGDGCLHRADDSIPYWRPDGTSPNVRTSGSLVGWIQIGLRISGKHSPVAVSVVLPGSALVVRSKQYRRNGHEKKGHNPRHQHSAALIERHDSRNECTQRASPHQNSEVDRRLAVWLCLHLFLSHVGSRVMTQRLLHSSDRQAYASKGPSPVTAQIVRLRLGLPAPAQFQTLCQHKCARLDEPAADHLKRRSQPALPCSQAISAPVPAALRCSGTGQ